MLIRAGQPCQTCASMVPQSPAAFYFLTLFLATVLLPYLCIPALWVCACGLETHLEFKYIQRKMNLVVMHIWAPADVMLKTRSQHARGLSFQRVMVWLVRYNHQEDQLSLVYFQMYRKILPPPYLLQFYSLHDYFTSLPFFFFLSPVALVLGFCISSSPGVHASLSCVVPQIHQS